MYVSNKLNHMILHVVCQAVDNSSAVHEILHLEPKGSQTSL